ncbi:MAG: NAD(P)/FAD-dependent oxidoreductase, partial [Actinomycetota bacterium]
MESAEALVIGGGPAGLMAAEMLGGAGHRVLLAEAMPTLGRKFLMAGKSGLNLTKGEPPAAFRAGYGAAAEWLTPALDAFGPDAVQDWARGLGQEVFTGSTGRVFPMAMKA